MLLKKLRKGWDNIFKKLLISYNLFFIVFINRILTKQ
jgi:hypothetical protein